MAATRPATLQTEVFEKQADLRRTAFDASQAASIATASLIVCGGCARPALQWCPDAHAKALWAMKVELFQRFHTACVIQLEIGSQGIGRDGAQLCDLVMR